jgi:glycosyltransferase involved in cell wall biosynthesis
MSKKILIIAYYWPPSGGSGVQRWLKFVKYLPQTGWQPIVFTPENPSFGTRDESLLKDIPPEAQVIHFPIWEPYEAFFRLSRIFGKSNKSKSVSIDMVAAKTPSLFQRFSTWLRANFFVPDPRICWIKPAVRFLSEFLKEHQITTVITTGPPHSLHLIGLRLKKKNQQLRWIADFRDPWSAWGFLDSLGVGKYARAKHRRLEAEVLRTADEVLTITPFYVRHFEALGKRPVQLFTNGFDEDDFAKITHTKSAKFLIRHIGIVNEKCDPKPFLKVLSEIALENSDFAKAVQMEFIGEVHIRIKEFVRHSQELSAITVFTGNIPHSELMNLYGSTSLLLLVLLGYKDAEGYMPGKLFEYMATGLPVLGLGPVKGDAANLIQESGIGVMLDGEDADGMKHYVLDQFRAWQNGSVRSLNTAGANNYSRRAITIKLAKLLEQQAS